MKYKVVQKAGKYYRKAFLEAHEKLAVIMTIITVAYVVAKCVR
jgi:hypothetical protein